MTPKISLRYILEYCNYIIKLRKPSVIRVVIANKLIFLATDEYFNVLELYLMKLLQNLH